MCIRDSNYNAGKVCGEDLKEKMPDGGKLVIVEDKADPVSYTHLDVYKRQAVY